MSKTNNDPIPDDASPLTCLKRLGSDEEASVAVEFIILIPIYLLLLAGLFMVSNLALIRSALVQANRFQAWAPEDSGKYPGLGSGSSFFGPYKGTYVDGVNPDASMTPTRTMTPVTFKDSDANSADLSSYVGAAPRGTQSEKLAADALDNVGGTDGLALWRIEALGAYRYEGIRILGMGPITQRTRCAVLLSKKHTRKEYDQTKQGDPHPVLDWHLDGGTVKSKFDPTVAKNMPLSPKYKGFFNKSAGGGARDDGIWDRVNDTSDGARINGDITSEQKYYNSPSKTKATHR